MQMSFITQQFNKKENKIPRYGKTFDLRTGKKVKTTVLLIKTLNTIYV